MKRPMTHNPSAGAACVLLLLLISISYSNTLKASWHFDDGPNITQNDSIKINNLHPASLWQAAHYKGQINRPLARISLAMNWYFGKDRVIGYHLVNIAFHMVSAVFLFFTVQHLLNTPNIKGRFDAQSAHDIALLSAALWAVNPIQVQAVTYIVQRMTSMAAMFTIISLLCYIRARRQKKWKAVIFYAVCILCYALAVACKENAIVLPLMLLLIELIFFRDLNIKALKSKDLKAAGWTVLTLAAVVCIAMVATGYTPSAILQPYETRSFTPGERLLTEPRVIVFYLTQIFYPIPQRLSLEHDVLLSTSFWHPWTTLPAILLIFLLIGTALLQSRKWPLLSFAVLFFFLNHLVESTIIPLELIFEHRNYLPSFFLFLPVAVGLQALTRHYRKKNPLLAAMVLFFSAVLVGGLGLGTHARNLAWATQEGLWLDALAKAPGRARPYQGMAIYYNKVGRYDMALVLFQQSLKAVDARPDQSRVLAYANMAASYLKKQDYHKVIFFSDKALSINPRYEKAIYNKSLALVRLARWNEAAENADRLLETAPFHETYLNLKAFVLLKQGAYGSAIPPLKRALQQIPFHRNTLIHLGMAHYMMRNDKQADFFLLRARQLFPDDMLPVFCLINSKLKAGRYQQAAHLADDLFAKYSVHEIKKKLSVLAGDEPIKLIPRGPLAAFLGKRLEQRVRCLDQPMPDVIANDS